MTNNGRTKVQRQGKASFLQIKWVSSISLQLVELSELDTQAISLMYHFGLVALVMPEEFNTHPSPKVEEHINWYGNR